MCGRYQLEYGIDQLMLRFDAQNRYIGYGTRYEIFPTDMVAIIRNEGNHNYIDTAKWGLDNHFDKRPLINARGETVDEKKTFKSMFISGRCIIPATSFFEWKKNVDGRKTKTLIGIPDVPVFGMAGLYKTEIGPEGNPLLRCTIITTSSTANPSMAEIHDRMPVILTQEVEKIWLDNTISDTVMLKEFLKPYIEEMFFKAVS